MEKGVDHIGITTVFFCHDGRGKFVMAKRSPHARDEQGRWDIGGGGLEFGEAVEERLKREIEEEYCTEIVDYDFLGFRDVHREHGGKPTHWISLDFRVRVNPERVKIGEPRKFDEIGWFSLSDLPENLHSQLPYFLKKYKDRL